MTMILVYYIAVIVSSNMLKSMFNYLHCEIKLASQVIGTNFRHFVGIFTFLSLGYVNLTVYDKFISCTPTFTTNV